jgi:hypothetical protein
MREFDDGCEEDEIPVETSRKESSRSVKVNREKNQNGAEIRQDGRR